jgi:hypothetical protein
MDTAADGRPTNPIVQVGTAELARILRIEEADAQAIIGNTVTSTWLKRRWIERWSRVGTVLLTVSQTAFLIGVTGSAVAHWQKRGVRVGGRLIRLKPASSAPGKWAFFSPAEVANFRRLTNDAEVINPEIEVHTNKRAAAEKLQAAAILGGD